MKPDWCFFLCLVLHYRYVQRMPIGRDYRRFGAFSAPEGNELRLHRQKRLLGLPSAFGVVVADMVAPVDSCDASRIPV